MIGRMMIGSDIEDGEGFIAMQLHLLHLHLLHRGHSHNVLTIVSQRNMLQIIVAKCSLQIISLTA